MRFTSLLFLVFFLCVYVCFWGSRRTRLPLLFLASFAFYAAWSIGFALHFLGIICASYFFIRQGHHAHQESPVVPAGEERNGDPSVEIKQGKGRPYWLWAVLGLNLANLFGFKYAYAGALLLVDLGWIYATGVENPEAALRASWPEFALVLPLAISFYTFQICAYAIDVSRGQIPRDPGFSRFAVFILFFPQLVAGPIMRFHEFSGQLDSLHELRPRLPQISGGVYLLIQGFTKKLLIADNLLPATSAVLFSPEQYDWPSVVAGVVGFAAQLYCDFSGYTDIARGLAKLLGLNLPENFFAPYLSASFRDFWRNWHRTLTTWLREYVYIPLGGNRVSGGRAALNTLIVLVLIGVWHGAGYNFFMLGLSNGLYLIAEGALIALLAGWRPRGFVGRVWPSVQRGTGMVFTLAFVSLVMVMMATPDFATSLAVYARVFAFDAALGVGSALSNMESAYAGGQRFTGVDQLWGGFALALAFNALQRIRDALAARAASGDPAEWFFVNPRRTVLSLAGALAARFRVSNPAWKFFAGRRRFHLLPVLNFEESSMTFIESHDLEIPEAEEELELMQGLLAHAPEDLTKAPDSLGAFFDDCLRIFGIQVYFKHPPEDIISALRRARDYGVSLFIRGNAGPTEVVSLELEGRRIDVPGGTSEFNTALHWLSVYGIALTLRDGAAIKKLCDYHPENFEGIYDRYHISLARALMLFHEDAAKAEALLKTALAEAAKATVFPERGRVKGVPLIELADAVLFNRTGRIVECACEALRGHYVVSNTPDNNYLADLYIPYLIVGLCSVAYDCGVAFDIDCRYLPGTLVDASLL